MSSLVIALTAFLLSLAPSPEAIQEKERGDRLAANGDLTAAAEAYQNAEKLSPGYAEATNQLGFLMARQNRFDEAVTHFQKAIEADPGFALAYFNYGFVLRKQGRHAEAIEALDSYVKLAPEDAAGHYNLAESYRGVGDSANAIAAFERYLAAEKDAGKQARMEKARQAIEQLRAELAAAAPVQPAAAPVVVAEPAPAGEPVGATAAAVTAAPTDAVATSAPVPAASPTQSPAAATAPITMMAVTPERAALAQRKIGEALQLRAAGKKRESLFALQDAANADPSNAQAVFELGVAYADNYYFPQAVERWQRVLGMDVDEATKAGARDNIDKARRLMGGAPSAAPAAAGNQASQAVVQSASSAAAPPARQPELTPAAHQAYLQGSELYGRELYDEAIRQFDEAIAAVPGFPQAYAARGSAWFAMHEFTRALADYSQAMRLDSTLASPVLGVAEALNALGRKSDAIPYYQAYIASTASDVQPGLQEIARQRLAEIGQ